MNTDTVVIRASMADLIAVAFYRVGYRPRESLVTVGMTGPRHRVGVVCRIDLPPARQRRAMVASSLRMIQREGHDHVVALVVSDAAVPPSASGTVRLPHRPLVRELRRQAPRHGLTVFDTIAVGATHWRSYRCTDVTCCPPEGHSLEAALTGPAAARLIAEGYVLAADEQGLVADVDPSPPSEASARPAPGAGPASGAAPGGPGEAEGSLRRWRALLAEPATATPADLAWLAEALEDHQLRDAALLTLVPGSGTVPDEVVAGADPAVMDAVLDAAPDDDLLERGRVLLSAVARSAQAGRRADALALLAWAAWWAGRGARGRLLADRALDDVPTHRLARLVDELLLVGVPPPWVVRTRDGRG